MHYDRSSKQSEQTAEENQQLLASNDELKEKVQELDKASQALQVSLFEEWIALFITVLCLALVTAGETICKAGAP